MVKITLKEKSIKQMKDYNKEDWIKKIKECKSWVDFWAMKDDIVKFLEKGVR